VGSLLEVAAELAPELSSRVPEMEKAGRLPADLAATLADAGLMGMCVSSDVGGPEADPREIASVIETLSAANPSAGWCAMISSTTAVLSGWVDDDARHAIFGDPAGIYAGAYAPTGVATPAAKGLRIEGRWAWGSGSQNATWFTAGCLLEDGSGFRLCFVPAGEVEIIENWDVMGLRGTGSHDWAVHGAEVPISHAVDLLGGRPVLDAPLYQLPVFGVLATMVSAVGLGIGVGAVEAFRELAGAKTPTLQSKPLARRATVQATLAQAATALDAARALLHQAIGSAIAAPGELSSRVDLRRAATHAAHTAASVVTTMHTLAGGTSVRNDAPFGRLLRDAHTVTQHLMVGPATWESCGRAMLGGPVEVGEL
jgi:alkylation response protein AidB-like acyl-CoA dehydrogenase